MWPETIFQLRRYVDRTPVGRHLQDCRIDEFTYVANIWSSLFSLIIFFQYHDELQISIVVVNVLELLQN